MKVRIRAAEMSVVYTQRAGNKAHLSSYQYLGPEGSDLAVHFGTIPHLSPHPTCPYLYPIPMPVMSSLLPGPLLLPYIPPILTPFPHILLIFTHLPVPFLTYTSTPWPPTNHSAHLHPYSPTGSSIQFGLKQNLGRWRSYLVILE